ncbi:cupin domain-containing protein [Puniceicoccaceae bacterium K14]|nr:cupin domain-containing protein [Puniceicoccaceae bacterium K14]
MKTVFRIALIINCLSPLVLQADDESQSPVIRKELLSAALLEVENVSRIEIKEITLTKRVTDIAHMHPCPVIGQILEGSIVFQIEDGEEIVLNEGDAFYEPANTEITRFDNLGPGPAKFLACYLLSKDDGNLIQMLNKD